MSSAPRIDDEAFNYALRKIADLLGMEDSDPYVAADRFAQSLGLQREHDPRVMSILKVVMATGSPFVDVTEIEDSEMKQGAVGVMIGLLLAEYHGWQAPLREEE